MTMVIPYTPSIADELIMSEACAMCGVLVENVVGRQPPKFHACVEARELIAFTMIRWLDRSTTEVASALKLGSNHGTVPHMMARACKDEAAMIRKAMEVSDRVRKRYGKLRWPGIFDREIKASEVQA